MTTPFTPPPGPGSLPPGPPAQPSPVPASGVGRSGGSPPPVPPRRGAALTTAAWLSVIAGVAIMVGVVWSVAMATIDRGLEPADADHLGSLNAMQVVAGMCLADVGTDGPVGEVEVVRCDGPHAGEVVTTMTLPVAQFPGDAEVAEQAADHCGSRLEQPWVAWAPTQESWDRGDRTVQCIAVADGTASTDTIGS